MNDEEKKIEEEMDEEDIKEAYHVDLLSRLHDACLSGNLNEIEILLTKGANARIYATCFPIYQCHDVEVLQLLLRHSADPNSKDENNYTILHYASRKGLVDIVELMLISGADPNFMSKHGVAPIHLVSDVYLHGYWCELETFEQCGGLPVPLLVKPEESNINERYCEIMTMLLKHKASVNIQTPNLRYSPLHLACFPDNNVEIVKILLNHGADPTLTSRSGNTALHRACRGSDLEMIATLMDAHDYLHLPVRFLVYPLDGPPTINTVETPSFLAYRKGNYRSAALVVIATLPSPQIIVFY